MAWCDESLSSNLTDNWCIPILLNLNPSVTAYDINVCIY